METRIIYINLLMFILISRFQTGQSLSCLPCGDRTQCEEPVCVGGVVLDACGCCNVCAKQEGEPCEGLFGMLGRCDSSLICVMEPHNGDHFQNNIGTCRKNITNDSDMECKKFPFFGCNFINGNCECGQDFTCSNPFQFTSQHMCYLHKMDLLNTNNEDRCKNVHCDVHPSPICPEDSILVEGYVREGECCPVPSRCECRMEICTLHPCPPGTMRNLLPATTGMPGACCDTSECLPISTDLDECLDVYCVFSWESLSCPLDSIATQNHLSKCCPGETICECQESLCEIPTCPAGVYAQISYKGNGKPGSCCDVYKCSNDSAGLKIGCIVNGTLYEDGKDYFSECRECRCQNGVSICEPLSCPDLPCEHLKLQAGGCCPICIKELSIQEPPQSLCLYGMNTYTVGQNWTADQCTYCTCVEGGKVQCKAAFCHEPPLISTTLPCPDISWCPLDNTKCQDGLDRDKVGCFVCQCKDGPPACPTLENCNLRCSRGYITDQDGCDRCKCKPKRCKQLSSCRKQCPYGYKTNPKGCDRCKCSSCPPLDRCSKHCSDGFAINKYGCEICRCKDQRDKESVVSIPKKICYDHLLENRYDDGETWSSDCYICICRGGQVMCDLLKCPNPNCNNPQLSKDSCCPTCPGEFHYPPYIPQSLSCQKFDGDRVAEGEIWDINQCLTCTCHSSHLMCTSKECLPITCDEPYFDETSCCPKCSVSPSVTPLYTSAKCYSDDGNVYENESWFQIDPCTRCFCQNELIKCFNQTCPELSCTDQVLKRGQCCLQCLGTEEEIPSYSPCQSDDNVRAHGEHWNATFDGCVTCTCVDGSVLCKEPYCVPLPINCVETRTLPHSCCPECVTMEDYNPVSKDPVVKPVNSAEFPFYIFIIIAAIILILIAVIVILTKLKWKCRKTGKSRFRSDTKTDDNSNLRHTAESGAQISPLLHTSVENDKKTLQT